MEQIVRESTWNTFTISDDKFIKNGEISKTIGEINNKLNIHSEYKDTDDIVGIIHCDEKGNLYCEVLVNSNKSGKSFDRTSNTN